MRPLLLLLMLLTSAACSGGGDSYPTRAQFAQQFDPAYCSALERCDAVAFGQQYLNVNQCAAYLGAGVTNPNGAATCTQAQTDACVHDVWTMACPVSFADWALPASCQGC